MIRWLIVFIAWIVPSLGFAAETLPIDKLVVQATIPRGGDFIAFGFDSLWMMGGSRMVRADPTDNSFTEIDVPGSRGRYRGVAIGEGAVWIPDTGNQALFKIDPKTNRVAKQIPIKLFDSEGSIGIGEGSVWIVTTAEGGKNTLMRLNAETLDVEASIPVERGSISVVTDYGSVWVTNNDKAELYRIDPRTNNVVSVVPLHERPRFIASGEESIWVLNQGDGTVQRLDSKTGAVIATIDTEGGAHLGGDIVVGGGYVWINLKGTPVIQIDPRTNTLVRKFKGYGMGDAIRYGAGSLWVSGRNIFRIRPPD